MCTEFVASPMLKNLVKHGPAGPLKTKTQFVPGSLTRAYLCEDCPRPPPPPLGGTKQQDDAMHLYHGQAYLSGPKMNWGSM